MIDLKQKYCTYETVHPTGFVYRGKGMTAKVHKGTYLGSGVRFNLILLFSPEFARNTWVTTILATFDSEDDAYDAEALLVPLESLKNPFVLNDTEGGRKGKFRTRNTLMKSVKASSKAESRKAKAESLKLLKQSAAANLKVIAKMKKQMEKDNVDV